MKGHEVLRSFKTYEPGDFWLYQIECTCGKICGGWTIPEAKEDFKKHIEKEDI